MALAVGLFFAFRGDRSPEIPAEPKPTVVKKASLQQPLPARIETMEWSPLVTMQEPGVGSMWAQPEIGRAASKPGGTPEFGDRPTRAELEAHANELRMTRYAEQGRLGEFYEQQERRRAEREGREARRRETLETRETRAEARQARREHASLVREAMEAGLEPPPPPERASRPRADMEIQMR
jgi:hypothetical protein